MTKIELMQYLAPFDDDVEIRVKTGNDYATRHRKIVTSHYIATDLVTGDAYIVLEVDNG